MFNNNNKKVTVLVAEDDENSRVLLETALSANNYKVYTAANGQDALILAVNKSPDIIISDILMPIMDGYAFCHALKKHQKLKNIPFIFYTATYTEYKDKELALSMGASRFVIKPVEMQELIAIMESLLKPNDADPETVNAKVMSDEELEMLHNERLQNKLSEKLAELEKQKSLLLTSEQRFRDYAAASADWFWEADGNMLIMKVTGGPAGLISRQLVEIANYVVNESNLGETGSQLLKALSKKAEFQDVILAFPDDNNHQPVSIRFSGKPIINEQNQFLGYRGVGRDVTETVNLIRKIEYLATHDELTGLPNRTYLWEQLRVAVTRAERNGYHIILLFIDVDNFKMINDTMGHIAGDQLLLEISKRLSMCVRIHDTLARIGGDEFVVVLEQCLPSDAHLIVLSILKAFEKPIIIGGLHIFTSVSIGLSIYPDDTDQVQTLVSYADLAMYRAKGKGRNNFHYYTEELNDVACEWMELENGLRHALDKNELYMVYQPQIRVENGQIEGIEALLRWRHPEKGFISPVKFIPIAEQSQLIIKLGVWCLNTVCKQIKNWDSDGLMHLPRVSVNISAKHTSNRRIFEDINRLLNGYGISADRLGIEITEHALIENVETIRATLDEIHQSGTYLSLDDFGTGYSSLSYLKQIPVNELKIDRSFIGGIVDEASDLAIVKAIVALGKSLGMKVCAEGVETIEQLNVLKALDCDLIQGYLIAKPMPADELKKWVTSYSDTYLQDLTVH